MKKVTVNYINDQGLIDCVTVEVPDSATQEEIEEAAKKELQSKP